MIITGYTAIEYAEANGLTLNKYNDPTEDAREGLTIDEAREVASEDPNLIYVEPEEAIIFVTPDIEIHAALNNRWAVVRGGQVVSRFDSLSLARKHAAELAESEQ